MVWSITEGAFFTICIVLVINLTYQPNSVDARMSSGHLGHGGGTRYDIYSCPLNVLGKKCGKKRGVPGVYDPYGAKHVYLRIGNTCYDWGAGTEKTARHLSCFDPKIACCVEGAEKEKSGVSYCADRVLKFEDAWLEDGREYDLADWNCQVYVDAMIDFLNVCYADASDFIPR